ncbi:zinc-ribbon domain-containing protein [Actinomycetospora termitidis]|uniref:Zinc-ribbon domain-containing protein n=1 Tax=Actinomycetospora termitidis TaxID=3053470 RepID=A0ABT7M9M6_9PSEU|nr:zinc-ribbon domain-containing protein [Actinomycetospora sp. Odt1-22]MDL5157355.1 zinc-ribbon domain-containing protein [Actinomycetospora sp. Odt1-22]
MLIFGTRRTAQQLAVLMLTCPQGHPAAHTVTRLVTRFTLFFVPLFRVRTRHVVQCTLCGMSGQVSTERAEELVTQAAST